MRSKKWWVLSIIVVIFLLYFLVVKLLPARSTGDPLVAANEYVGNRQCKSCHQQEHAAWETSDHFKAMLAPNDSTVVGDFDNAVFTADGVTSRFFKRGNDFYINTEGPGGKNQDYKVEYTFGYFPLQQYLVSFAGGRMQVPRVSWDVKAKKWFHQYAGQKIPHADWLHWTGAAQNWNTMCASCHSTNLQKNYDVVQDNFHTTFSSINVTCESCHGAGKKHVDYMKSGAYKTGEKVPGFYINLVTNQLAQINACVPCHALKADISADLIQSTELLDNIIPQIPTTEHFYADGQVKDEDYIYTSFLQSKMMHRGVKCSNCHNPHTGKPLFNDNNLCLQCHSKTYDDPSHHFHQINTEGAQCKSCHMPGDNFMGNDFRHDHSLRVPRPDLSVTYGTPNACNKCHNDKSNEWAAAAVVKNFGNDRKYHFAEDLIPGSKLDANAEGHLQKILNDTASPAIIKATAAYYLGNIFTPSSIQTLVRALQNKEAIIRYHAIRALANSPAENWQQVAAPLLADKVRAVRIAAADLFLTIPPDQISDAYQHAFAQAKDELSRYLYFQADFADGNVMLGDHYLRLTDYQNAEKFYLRALKKDSLLNYTRLNLSVVYSATGNNTEALKVLQTAAQISPRNDRVFYNMGLLYTELKDTAAAAQNFDKAVRLNSVNPRLYYNYGLVLYHQNKIGKAVAILQKGLELSPADSDLREALQYVQRKP
jgi:tetratricopeptide (TPR) repeat protein